MDPTQAPLSPDLIAQLMPGAMGLTPGSVNITPDVASAIAAAAMPRARMSPAAVVSSLPASMAQGMPAAGPAVPRATGAGARSPVVPGGGVAALAPASVPHASGAKGKVGQYASDFAGGVGAVDWSAPGYASFVQGLSGAIQAKRARIKDDAATATAAEDKAYERGIRADDRAYSRTRDAATDARFAASEDRANRTDARADRAAQLNEINTASQISAREHATAKANGITAAQMIDARKQIYNEVAKQFGINDTSGPLSPEDQDKFEKMFTERLDAFVTSLEQLPLDNGSANGNDPAATPADGAPVRGANGRWGTEGGPPLSAEQERQVPAGEIYWGFPEIDSANNQPTEPGWYTK